MKIVLSGMASLIGLAFGQTAYADSPPPPPPPVHNSVCLSAGSIDHTSYPDDRTILFYMNSGKVRVWRNDLPRECPGLKFEQGIAYEIRGGEICSNMQVVYVLHRWTPCFLGAFTPYEKPMQQHAPSAPPAN